MEQIEFIAAAASIISALNELAEKTSVGFFPFSECTASNREEWEDGVVYLDDPEGAPIDMKKNDVLADMAVEGGQHSAITSYGSLMCSMADGFVTATAYIPDEGSGRAPRIDVAFHVGDGWGGPFEFTVENGRWRANR